MGIYGLGYFKRILILINRETLEALVYDFIWIISIINVVSRNRISKSRGSYKI